MATTMLMMMGDRDGAMTLCEEIKWEGGKEMVLIACQWA